MAFRRRRESLAPEVEALRPGEIEWRDQQLAVAGLLAQRYCGAPPDVVPSAQLLDDIVVGWLDDDDSRVDVNVVVNAIGIAFGTHLAAATGLNWVIATDEHGSDLALHGQPGDIMVYPANAVAKRVVASERRFVVSLLGDMTRGIKERRAQS
jgi:hypothetical protein